MENTETTPTPLMNHALRWGLIVGIISAVLTFLYYAIDYSLLAEWKVGIFSLLLYIGFTIYAGINYRNEAGGFLSYGKAYQHGFMVFAVSGLIATIATILLFQVIDTGLAEKVTEVGLEKTEAMMNNFGAPQDQIDKALEDTRTRMENQYTLSGQLMGYGFILIVSAILALITSLFVRKTQPVDI